MRAKLFDLAGEPLGYVTLPLGDCPSVVRVTSLDGFRLFVRVSWGARDEYREILWDAIPSVELERE